MKHFAAKLLLLVITLCLLSAPLAMLAGCATSPATQAATYHTLHGVALAGQAAIDAAAILRTERMNSPVPWVMLRMSMA